MPPGSIGDYGYFNSQDDSDVEAEDDQARPSNTSTNPRNRPSLGRFNPRGGLPPPSTPTRRARPRDESDDDPFRPATRPRLGDSTFRSSQTPTPAPRFATSITPNRQAPTPSSTQSSARSPQPAPVPNLPVNGPLPAAPQLSADQRKVVDVVMTGNNCFFTGPAGSGKSTTISHIVAQLRARGKRVRLMASTGQASLAIAGSTIWTYAGWRPEDMKSTLNKLKDIVTHGGAARARMRDTDVIIIDEISMVENLFFQRLNDVMQRARQNSRAFGGVQMIVTGDFYQLPPVKPFSTCIECGADVKHKRKYTEHQCPRGHHVWYDDEKWVFRSDAWKDCAFVNVFLNEVHRQADSELKRLLNKMRRGEPFTKDEIRLLWDHASDVEGGVKLFSKHSQVNEVNHSELMRLPGNEYRYHCYDAWRPNEDHEHLQKKGQKSADGTLVALKNHSFDAHLRLKMGMPVILLVNMDVENGLVNGSQGKIVDFVRYEDARAATGRGGQDYNEDLNDWQERNAMEGARTYGGGWNKLEAEDVKQFMNLPTNQDRFWPVVKFSNGLKKVVMAWCQVTALGDDKPFSLLSRTQIPLAAGWAITIHRAQGMTLDKVTVELSQTFETGQEYVALSRAKTLSGLKLLGTPKDLGGVNEQVKKFIEETRWYNRMEL